MANSTNMDVNKLFATIHAGLPNQNTGKVADYIPELGKIDPDKFGVQATTIDGQEYAFGDAKEPFSIQSIAKVFSLTLAYQKLNKDLWKRVGVEPSGTPFNSLVQLEADKGIPRNPMINAGALVVCDVLLNYLKDPKAELLSFVRSLSSDNSINYNKVVAQSELDNASRNRARLEYMRSLVNCTNPSEDLLDF